MNRLHGDIPKEHQDCADRLENLREWTEKNEKSISKEAAARMYVCIAHDWYCLDLEEEGERLLRKAAQICSRYFSDSIYQDMSDDCEFDRLVRNFSNVGAGELVRSLGLNV